MAVMISHIKEAGFVRSRNLFQKEKSSSSADLISLFRRTGQYFVRENYRLNQVQSTKKQLRAEQRQTLPTALHQTSEEEYIDRQNDHDAKRIIQNN